MADLLIYREMWIENDHRGMPSIRLTIDPEDGPIDFTNGYLAFVRGTDGEATEVFLRFLAVVKNRAMFEALPVNGERPLGHLQAGAWRLIWWPLLAKN